MVGRAGYANCVAYIIEDMKDALNEWKKSDPILQG